MTTTQNDPTPMTEPQLDSLSGGPHYSKRQGAGCRDRPPHAAKCRCPHTPPE